MEITKEQSMAYTEVLEVLKHVLIEDRNKIPDDIINYYEAYQDKDYLFKIDETKPFDEQNLSKRAKVVLATLFRDYWATDTQKNKILQKEKSDLQLLEEEKQRMYNPDNIFANRAKAVENKPVQAMTEYVELKWYQRIWGKIKGLFKVRK